MPLAIRSLSSLSGDPGPVGMRRTRRRHPLHPRRGPDLLADQDADAIDRATKAYWQALRPLLDITGRDDTNWTVIVAPFAGWADRVVPEAPADQRTARLWEILFEVMRLNLPDPVAAWEQHLDALEARRRIMNNRRYRALHYTGPGTDLLVQLPADHIWMGGRASTAKGVIFTPNLPTEEVFTLPHRQGVEGVVHASLPLSYAGTLIEDFSLTFEKGRVAGLSAARGRGHPAPARGDG